MKTHALLAIVALSAVTVACAAASQGAPITADSGPFTSPDLPTLAGQAATCAGGREKTFTLEARESTIDLGMGVRFNAWTYNGQLPGPALEACEGDRVTIEKSGLPLLEQKLSVDIIPTRHMLIRSRIIHEISGRVESSRALIEAKLNGVNKQLYDLKALSGKNLDAIQKMVARMRQEKKKYDKEIEGFQLTRAALSRQAQILLGHLSMTSLDDLIAKTRVTMNETWTTRGLKNGMATFFAGTRERMDKVNYEADEIRKVVEAIYLRLHTEYSLSKIIPPRLSLLSFVMEFKKLEERADSFRDSPVTVMTEQHFVVKKFFITLVSQARQLFNECNTAAKNWFQAAVSPVFAQIHHHKAMIDRSFEALKKIHENMDSLGERISELEDLRKDLEEQLKTTDHLLERIHKPLAE